MDTNKLINSLSDMANFVTVVEEGGFSAASRKIGVTPSAVSRQVTRLERALGVRLLERSTRKVQLSVAGRPVYELCRTMLDSAREAAQVSRSVTKDPVGILRIAAPKAVAKCILEPLLLSFMAQYPQIELQLKVTDHIVDPLHNEVDLLVSLERDPALGLIAKEMGEVKIVLCASPEYLANNPELSKPEALIDHSVLTLGENANDKVLEMQKGATLKRVNISGRYSVNHSQMRLNAALQGVGIALLQDFVAKESLENGSLISVLDGWHIKHNYQGTLRLQYAASNFIPERLKLLVAHLTKNSPLQREQC